MSMPRTAGRRDPLPPSLPPRGLDRAQAAAYVGLSPSTFDKLVRDGRMPKPTHIGARVVWDRIKVDEAFSALLDNDDRDDDPWAKAAV